MNGYDFGEALNAMRRGYKVARVGWNGKGMWLLLVPEYDWTVAPSSGPINAHRLPWIGMKTADGGFVPWLASQTDVLANDWLVVP